MLLNNHGFIFSDLPGKLPSWLLVFFFPLFTSGQGSTQQFPLIQDIYQNGKSLEFGYAGIFCDTFYYADKFAFDLGIEQSAEWFQTNHIIRRELPGAGPDSIILTPMELRLIQFGFNKLKKHSWKNNLFPLSVMFKSEKITEILSEVDQSRIPLEKKLCKTIYSFLPPIFFRDDSWCIFFQSESNVISQGGDCSVYHKEQGTWKRYLYISRWMDLPQPGKF